MKKRPLLLLIVLSIILSVTGFVYADEVEDMSCGDHAVWSYDSQSKTLTISGTGPMYNYRANMAPWNGNCAIQHIVVEEGITHIGDFAFEGLSQMNRGQVVTFLWRAAGSPEPTSVDNPFNDVKEGKFYYDAVLWAVEAEVTNGMTPTTFAPNNICTRGQIVTFLYRALG